MDIARKYAFCFGQPEDLAPGPWSIGQFGVGMKRALFKLGGWFRVESVANDSRFVLEESSRDGEPIARSDGNLDSRKFTRIRLTVPESKRGTKILVRELREEFPPNLSSTTSRQGSRRAYARLIRYLLAKVCR